MEKENNAGLPALPEITTGTQTSAMTNPFDKNAVQTVEPEPMTEAVPVTPEPEVKPLEPSVGSPVPVMTEKEVIVTETNTKTKLPFGMKTFPVIGAMVALVVILAVAIAGMLFLTPQGQKLIGLYKTSSSTSTQSTSSSTTSSTAASDFSDSDANETVDQVTSDIDSQVTSVNSDQDFESFDSQVEFGL